MVRSFPTTAAFPCEFTMAIAHVCVHCGWDLARVRPAREPHYGMMLVRCPHCGAAAVRSRHPVQKAWREFLRLDFALTLIGVRLVGIVALTFFWSVACVIGLALASRLGSEESRIDPEARLLIAIFYFALPLLLGAFLSAAFAHIARWKVWLGWLAWSAAVLAIISLHGPFGSDFDPRSSQLLWRGETLSHVLMGLQHVALPAAGVSAIMLVMALPGIFLGNVLLRVRDTLLRAAWRWRLKRLRLAGAANV